jgi:hypothetical protein
MTTVISHVDGCCTGVEITGDRGHAHEGERVQFTVTALVWR